MQPAYEIRFHPCDLSMHGVTRTGASIYRIVWADTRKTKVICRGKLHELPRYFHGEEGSAGGHWVLEKYADAQTLVGMTREQWDAFIATVPNPAVEEYPTDGDWELSRVFNEDTGPFSRHIDEAALHKQLFMHEHRHIAMTDEERRLAVQAEEDAKEAKETAAFESMYDESKESYERNESSQPRNAAFGGIAATN